MKDSFQILLNEFHSWFNPTANRDKMLLQTSIFLKKRVYHYDWVGFYLLDSTSNELVLGPFAGKPTEHTHIPVGKGVCGQVAESKITKIVQDVSCEENYISCSIDVQSEIVVPVIKGDKFVAEIDIDSHSTAPFSTDDDEFLTAICTEIAKLF